MPIESTGTHGAGVKHVEYPSWWSEELRNLMEAIEVKVHQRSETLRQRNRGRGQARSRRLYTLAVVPAIPIIPNGLPENLINRAVLETFDALSRKELQLSPALQLPDIIGDIFPRTESDCHPRWKPSNKTKATGSRSEEEIEEDSDISEENSLFDGDDDDEEMGNGEEYE
jgi:hypothetical protein